MDAGEKVAEGIADARAGRVVSSTKVEAHFAGRRAAAGQHEFRAFLDALENPAPISPELQSETFSRTFIYSDHD
jgi:hypothetical protein